MESKSDSSQREIFGSFYLCESEFSISVNYVQEVVNPPERYTVLPLAPAHLLGLFNLRGTIIPVVDLKVLLQLPGERSAGDQKIAILELNNQCIGLLFDQTGEIFRCRSEEYSEFSDTTKIKVIQGVFKKDSGRRLIQNLDIGALFDLQEIPRESEQARGHGRNAALQRKGQRQQGISFLVGPAKCALGIDEIQEILKVEKMESSALGVGHCIGVIDLRGVTVPVIDFAALLKYRERDVSPQATQGNRRIVVMREGDEMFGLLVDGVDSIVTYYAEDLKNFPALHLKRRDLFVGCISVDGQNDILLLNHKTILSDSDILEITRGHSRIFRANDKRTDVKKTTGGDKKTFITFRVANLFAVSIGEVKEIIECPDKLLEPPGLPKYCKGILNLRGDLVTIVDAREMYETEKEDRIDPGKVLIFRNESQHFGLVVDSVEAIISISTESKIKMPELFYEKTGKMVEDVAEVIQCKDIVGQEQNLLILNSKSIGARMNRAA